MQSFKNLVVLSIAENLNSKISINFLKTSEIICYENVLEILEEFHRWGLELSQEWFTNNDENDFLSDMFEQKSETKNWWFLFLHFNDVRGKM